MKEESSENFFVKLDKNINEYEDSIDMSYKINGLNENTPKSATETLKSIENIDTPKSINHKGFKIEESHEPVIKEQESESSSKGSRNNSKNYIENLNDRSQDKNLPNENSNNNSVLKFDIDILYFEAWYNYNSKRIWVTIVYKVDSGKLFVEVMDGKTISQIDKIYNNQGRLLECWDFYVGASINVFGKNVELKKADVRTAAWNDRWGRKLSDIRKALVAELAKYSNKKLEHFLIKEFYKPGNLGQIPCREILKQIEVLKARLMEFRPMKVKDILSRVFD